MGVNAIRTSHNPPAPELLDLADKMGILILDEAFDAWVGAKKKNDYSTLFKDWHEKDLRSFIRRDRNHPSIIAWSIGNEIREQRPEGHPVAQMLRKIVHEEDPTRLVTAAANGGDSSTNGFQKTVDLFGLTTSRPFMRSFTPTIRTSLSGPPRPPRRSAREVNITSRCPTTRPRGFYDFSGQFLRPLCTTLGDAARY